MGVEKSGNGGIAKRGHEPARLHRAPAIGSDRLTDPRAALPSGPRRRHPQAVGRQGPVPRRHADRGELWRLKYRYEGKERVYSIGPFADVGLAEARAERAKVKGWLREGRTR